MLKYSGHIDILVGGGLKFSNIREIINKAGTVSYHFGTAVRKNNSMRETIDGEKLEKMIKIINSDRHPHNI